MDEATFFVNLAVISGALIGLTFIALNLFMVDLLRRYKETALPVFRERETKDCARKPPKPDPPESLTDRQLLDGDPVVVFMAFSVAVSWSLFLLPLVIGLTEAWSGRWGVLSAEMFSFSGILAFNFVVRAQKVKQMRPYLTREELLWPLMSGTALLLYLSTATVLLFAVFPSMVPIGLSSFASIWFGVTVVEFGTFLLKTSCIASLVLGTYTVNKDMFIYFKAASAERMRGRWLKDFFENTYSLLDERVRHLTSHMSPESKEADWLWNQWSQGPTSISDHDAFKEPGSEPARLLWKKLVKRGGKVPVWMLDVPSIARWAWNIERELDERRIKKGSRLLLTHDEVD